MMKEKPARKSAGDHIYFLTGLIFRETDFIQIHLINYKYYNYKLSEYDSFYQSELCVKRQSYETREKNVGDHNFFLRSLICKGTNDYLQASQKQHSDRIPFTLTFHPHNHSVKSIILKNFKLLQNDPETGTISLHSFHSNVTKT